MAKAMVRIFPWQRDRLRGWLSSSGRLFGIKGLKEKERRNGMAAEKALRGYWQIVQDLLEIAGPKVDPQEAADLKKIANLHARTRPLPGFEKMTPFEKIRRYYSLEPAVIMKLTLKTKSGNSGCNISTMHNCCGVLHAWNFGIDSSSGAINNEWEKELRELLLEVEKAAGHTTYGVLFATHYSDLYNKEFEAMGWEPLAHSDGKKTFYNPNSSHHVFFWTKRINQRKFGPPTKWPLGIKEPVANAGPKEKEKDMTLTLTAS